MYTSIKDFVKSKNISNTKKVNESKPVQVATTKIADNKSDNNSVLKLESVIKNLNICHFIISKGLINESASLTSINEAIKGEFNIANFFKTDEAFNSFYSVSMELTKEFLIEEGFLDKLASIANKTTNKSYVLDANIKASDKAQAFLNDPAYKKTANLAKDTLIKKGVPADKADTALIAMLNWTNGQTPNFSNTSVEYDSAKNELTFGSTAKGAGAKVF